MGVLDFLFGRQASAAVGELRVSSTTGFLPTRPTGAFQVACVTPATIALPEVPFNEAVESLLRPSPPDEWGRKRREAGAAQLRRVEACSSYHGRLVSGVQFHPVVAAIHLAFQDHRPLVLSPDIIWLLVAQGFANHVNANAEELRAKFVAHSGKHNLTVRRDEFVKGSPENPWADVFGEFSALIREHIGETTHDLLLPDFSTTGAVERAATEIVLIDAMQSFFTYEVVTMCGIPEIELEGTTADWQSLAKRTRELGQFGLEGWTKILEPILDEFVAASQGLAKASFWQSIYKVDHGSGGPNVTGWITAFFPYLKEWRTGLATEKNRWLAQGGTALQSVLYPNSDHEATFRFHQGPKTDAFPSGLARSPFLWQYLDQQYEMEFLGGFVGVRQNPDTLQLRPEIGWAVRAASGV